MRAPLALALLVYAVATVLALVAGVIAAGLLARLVELVAFVATS